MSSAVSVPLSAVILTCEISPSVAVPGQYISTVTSWSTPADKLNVPEGLVTFTVQPAKSIISVNAMLFIALPELFKTLKVISFVCPAEIVSFRGAVTVRSVIVFSLNLSIASNVHVAPEANDAILHSKQIALS